MLVRTTHLSLEDLAGVAGVRAAASVLILEVSISLYNTYTLSTKCVTYTQCLCNTISVFFFLFFFLAPSSSSSSSC